VEIPTGLPMVFDWRVNRVRLLEDDDVPNPLKKYNFGSSPSLLFKPEFMSEEDFEQTIATTSVRAYPYDPIIRRRKDP
jgi:hypothetical protein